ncbi:MAG: type II toxin-antitoxin system HipA family toxin [Bifidobacteriaceae bacterium]|jgi:serine/threonine-protein kinase HipA|nr:type II toxin-antitoxin system HipA family toxin [Bifidobacteriaceae bacterium]
MSAAPVEVLRVLAWGRQVGAAATSTRPPFASFEYDPEWLASGPELSPLLMPHAQGRRLHTFRDLDPAAFHGLPPLLADSLPDSFGNALAEAYLAGDQATPRSLTGLDRLAYLGGRGLGALTFEPDRGARASGEAASDLAGLVAAARAVVDGGMSGKGGRRAAVRRLQGIGTSAGGAQAKALIWVDGGEVLTRPGAGPPLEPWILKFDLASPPGLPAAPQGAGPVEYAYHLMARAAGVEVPEARLVEQSAGAHFMVRRFDGGPDGERLHQQSLAGLAGLDFLQLGAHSATQLFGVAARLGLGTAARSEILRRIAFNVLAGNRDDHPKNHAFLMTPEGEWSLAPAYDLTFAFDPANLWLARHHLAVEGKTAGISRADLMALADRCAVPSGGEVLDHVEHGIGQWPGLARDAGVPQAAVDVITGRLAALRRDWEQG